MGAAAVACSTSLLSGAQLQLGLQPLGELAAVAQAFWLCSH